jgi:hypothetical protein
LLDGDWQLDGLVDLCFATEGTEKMRVGPAKLWSDQAFGSSSVLSVASVAEN